MEPQLTASPSWFNQSLLDFADYPYNLVQTDTYPYSLNAYREKLNRDTEDKTCFHKEKRTVFFLDLQSPQNEYSLSDKIKDEDGARQFIQKRATDPISSFVYDTRPAKRPNLTHASFIQSGSNRNPLNCSREQLAFIFTYHQVMAPFLDLVFTFNVRGKPETIATLRCEDHLSESNLEFALPGPGRSGFRFQHCFNLVSVENDMASNPPWSLRQTALYHSFDPVKGKAFWVSLKGNSILRKRITESTKPRKHALRKPEAQATAGGRFVATLEVHLVLFQWCVENWPDYISYLEEKVRGYSAQGQHAPVAIMSEPQPIERAIVKRSATLNSTRNPSMRGTWASQKGGSQPPTLLRRLSKCLSVSDRLRKPACEQPAEPLLPAPTDELDLEKMFDMDKLQGLSRLEDEMQTALLVIQQDVRVMKEIMCRYSSLLESAAFQKHLDMTAHATDVAKYSVKSRELVRDMENDACRLHGALRRLENAKNQFYGILQYRNMRISDYFAQSAHNSSRIMEDMAVKSRQETMSMHAITIITLVFLPATFVASGVFDWDSEDSPAIRTEAMHLFFAISGPVTVATLVVWGWYWQSQRQTDRVWPSLEDSGGPQEVGLGDEKNLGVQEA